MKIKLTRGGLCVSTAPEMSGGGTQPPPKPHAPVKKPKPKPGKK